MLCGFIRRQKALGIIVGYKCYTCTVCAAVNCHMDIQDVCAQHNKCRNIINRYQITCGLYPGHIQCINPLPSSNSKVHLHVAHLLKRYTTGVFVLIMYIIVLFVIFCTLLFFELTVQLYIIGTLVDCTYVR